jgi:hypothetical protein
VYYSYYNNTRVLLCGKSAARLTTENGTTMEFSTIMTTDQASLLNQVHGNSLEEIRVVEEYLEHPYL